MINEDLIDYIQSQLKKNVSEETIIQKLSNAGWIFSDIQEGLRKVKEPVFVEKPIINELVIQKYIPETEEVEQVNKEESKVVELQYLEVQAPKIPDVQVQEEVKQEVVTEEAKQENKEESKVIELQYAELQKPSIFDVQTKEEIKKEITEEVRQEIKEQLRKEIIEEVREEVREEIKHENKPEVQPDLKVWTPSVLNPQVLENTETPIPITPITETITVPKDVDQQKEGSITPQEELIPVLVKNNPEIVTKPEVATDSNIHQNINFQKPTTVDIKNPVNKLSIIPNKALLSSYPSDVEKVRSSIVLKDLPVSSKSNLSKILLIIFGVGVVLVGTFFILKYFGIFSKPLITRDPKTDLLSALSKFSERDSYTVDTRIDVSSASISGITASLINDEVNRSTQKDNLSIKSKGKVNNKNNNNYFFDYQMSVKSTLLPEDIVTNIKYADKNFYIKFPELTKIFGINTPKETWVLTSADKVNLILKTLPPHIEERIKKVDVYNMLSGDVPPYVVAKFNKSFKNFIKNSEVILVTTEEFDNKMAYHYKIQPDRKVTKEFFTSLLDIFKTGNNPVVSQQIDEALGATVFDSIDVWIGTNDNTLYKYNFKMHTPLSKIMAFDDKSTSSNNVDLEWETTYSDLGELNKSNIPTDNVSIENYIKTINELKTKDLIDTFRVYTKNFYTTFGNFGKNNNKDGDCAHPTATSLFSPLGHGRRGDIIVGDISKVIQDLLVRVPTGMLCYSTSSSWAMSAPYMDGTSYCVDSSGFGDKTSIPLTGVVCKK